MRIVIPLFDRFTALDAVGPYEVLGHIPGPRSCSRPRLLARFAAAAGRSRSWPTLRWTRSRAARFSSSPADPGQRKVSADESFVAWVRRIHGTTTWTTSVCTGSLVLAAAGLLDGLEAATHWQAVAEAIQLVIEYDPQPPFDSGSPAKSRPETVAIVRSGFATAQS